MQGGSLLAPTNERGNAAVAACDATVATVIQQQQVQSLNQPVHLPDHLVAKLRSELEVVQGNMIVLAEMIQHFTNSEPQNNQQSATSVPNQADFELMEQLYVTCKAMRERVVDLIGRLVDDEMTAELLRINDELNNLFLRYSRYMGNYAPPSAILAQTLGQPPNDIESDTAGVAMGKANSKRPEQSLIDLDEETVHSLEQQISGIGN